MDNSVAIKTSKESDLVTYKILVEGTEIPLTYQIFSIVVTKEVNRLPTATIVIIDGDASKADFPVSNEDYLIPGKKIEITAGYHSDEATIFKGIVIKNSIKVRTNTSFLTIECRDEAVKMTIGRKSKYFYDSKDSVVFKDIIDLYSLENEIEDTNYEHKELVQFNASDWDFIVSRAQANGKLCFVDDGKITIAKPDLKQASLQTVAFGSTILDFDAEIDARNQFNKVSSYSWNQGEQEIVEIEANDPDVSLNGNFTVQSLADVIGLKNYELKHGGNLNVKESQDWADSTLLYQQLSKVRGRVRFQGIPTVKPGKILNLQGLGNRFNGNIYVTGVFHSIAEGNWTVDVQFGMNPVWFSETYDINALPASGLLPAAKGLQFGVVTQLQDDPDGEDRILVTLPIVSETEQGIWCRLALLDAGDNRGSIFRPDVGDEVVIGFINEDPNNAVVLGMLNSSAKPAPIPAEDDNNIKGFFTRSEMKFVFDDKKKSMTMETPSGKIITLDEDAGVIKLEDENKNILTMDSSGIVIESAGNIELKSKGDLTLEGLNVNFKASAQLKAEGTAGIEVSSNAIAVLKGSLVQIN
ncbi:MAG: type VI secretion system tip protein VgrG [Flavobacteriales bacterium]|nr:type VI secretion system tip protein VgrG [Flavobacteriales bacterium]